MKDVVNEIIYVDEESYQQMKKDINKSDDYFDMNEVQILKIKNNSAIIA